jgi:hypothetical protein
MQDLGGFHPVYYRHTHVHENDIWAVSSGELDHLFSVLGNTNYLDLRFCDSEIPLEMPVVGSLEE